jgi:hypothetical protein
LHQCATQSHFCVDTLFNRLGMKRWHFCHFVKCLQCMSTNNLIYASCYNWGSNLWFQSSHHHCALPSFLLLSCFAYFMLSALQTVDYE